MKPETQMQGRAAARTAIEYQSRASVIVGILSSKVWRAATRTPYVAYPLYKCKPFAITICCRRPIAMPQGHVLACISNRNNGLVRTV
jgi:hypothetical protein